MIFQQNFLIYDIETGGFSATKNPIMEFAMIALNHNLEEKERLEFFVKPYDDLIIEVGALKANGIPIQKVSDEGIDIKEVVQKIEFFIKKYTNKGIGKKPVLIGHNIKKFDNKFLTFVFKKFEKDFESYFSNFIDTMEWGRWKYGYKEILANFKLGTCCAKEDISIPNAHRAMNDTEANTKLFINYMNSLRSGVLGVREEVKNSRSNFYF